MAVTVTHSTAADGSFSAAGSTAWAATHTLAGFDGSTFPGGIAMTGVKYPVAYNMSVSAGDTDLYTVPTGKRALVPSIILKNNSGVGNITWFPEVKISGTYFRLGTNQTTTNTSVTQGAHGYIAEAGEVVAINTTTNNGAAVSCQIVEFDNTVSVYASKILSLVLGDNTVYTVPASKTAILLSSGLIPATGGTFRYVNSSGGVRTIIWKLTPNGGAATAVTASSTVNDAVSSSVTGLMTIGAGDSIQLNIDDATATQIAFVNVMEI